MTKTSKAAVIEIPAPAPKGPRPPVGLSLDAQHWWSRLTQDYAIDQHDSAGRLLLETALRAFDMMREAEGSIKKYGQVSPDKNGQLRPNPSAVILRDSRAAMLAALKSLNLDLEPLHTRPGRPGKG